MLEWTSSLLLRVLAMALGAGGLLAERAAAWGQRACGGFGPEVESSWARDLFDGRLALVGPRPSTLEGLETSGALRRGMVRPGLLSLYSVRKRANVAFDRETETELEYAADHSARGDVGILMRALLNRLSPNPDPGASRLTICGVPLDSVTTASVLDRIRDSLSNDRGLRITFVNADCVNKAVRDPEYRSSIESADLSLPDGIGVRLGSAILGRAVRENINGTDLFPRLCRLLEDTGDSIFLLGARPGVAREMERRLHERFPRLNVAGVQHGYFFEHVAPHIAHKVRQSGAAVVLTALGAPRQDVFNERHFEAMGVSVACGVGGLFDFNSGRVARAPVWIREIGMEWVYRMAQEPRRLWKRYLLGNIEFLFRVVWARLAIIVVR